MKWCSLDVAWMVPMVGMLRMNKWFNRDKNEITDNQKKKTKKKDKALNLVKILRLLVNSILLYFSFPFF